MGSRLDVSDARKQDFKYFDAIDHEMKKRRAREALLYMLLHRDLTGNQPS